VCQVCEATMVDEYHSGFSDVAGTPPSQVITFFSKESY
jgi:hypothetical protein